VWAPVVKPSYWQIGIDDITFNNNPTGLCGENGGCQVAVDTGTSMLAGPTALVDSLSQQIDVKSDCSNYDTLPNLGFQIGDKILNLRPEEYIDKDGDHDCSFSLMALDVPPPKGPLFIFGDPFLRRFVTVFDRENQKVGFGVAKNNVGGGRANVYEVIANVAGGAGVASTGGMSAGGESTNAVNVDLAGGMMTPGGSGGSSDSSTSTDTMADNSGTTSTPSSAASDVPESPSLSIDSDAPAPSSGAAAPQKQDLTFDDNDDFDKGLKSLAASAAAQAQAGADVSSTAVRSESESETPSVPVEQAESAVAVSAAAIDGQAQAGAGNEDFMK